MYLYYTMSIYLPPVPLVIILISEVPIIEETKERWTCSAPKVVEVELVLVFKRQTSWGRPVVDRVIEAKEREVRKVEEEERGERERIFLERQRVKFSIIERG